MKKTIKIKDFLVDFKKVELNHINDTVLSGFILNEEKKSKYIDLLNEFFDREIEDREIVLDDFDCDNGFIYKLMYEWYKKEFVVENGLGLCWYEYSLEDLFRDWFGIEKEYHYITTSYNLFSIKDLEKKLYKDLSE
jgi:hypothetical protein